MWVFGYGSLIWKADFPYEKILVGHIKGYVRRFYQKSTDHRGVPDRPGRVVTLLSSDNLNDQVWGIAYKISPQNIDTVVKHLDYREKGGYERKSVLFYPSHSLEDIGSSLSANNSFHINFERGEDNPNYAGVEDIHTIAKQILVSHGPSGANTEYLYKLASAMRIIASGIYDEHLFALETAVRTLEHERTIRIERNQNLSADQNR
uniref:putative glutathione-specific gamma-glutamylcyclotransferase 2 isoform X2 n=1 Tax=Osmia lignaria TaxID=473952 RepID=UPI0014795C0F|nr:putative glutathione-specific gamma-glutamylcyclotransferase 2 isoform X2 [Osmia lignaria]